MKIRRGDKVVVKTGDDAGETPHEVIQVLNKGSRLLIQGVNKVHKHVKRGHPKSPQGGRLSLEMPIDSSNVMFYCGSCSKGVRIGFRYTADGSKERYCRSCGSPQGTISGPKQRRATAS